MPCSTQALPLAPSAPDSPASPNNDLISRKGQSVGKQQTYDKKSYEAKAEALHHMSDNINEGHEMNTTCLLEVEGKLLVEAVEICKCSDKCPPKDVELAQRVPEDFKSPDRADIQYKWPSPEAINNEESSVLLHSRESTVVLTPPTPEPVSTFPAYSCPSPELEFWLCWKPPDTGENLT